MADEEAGRVELGAADLESLNADLAVKWRAMEAYADRLEKKSSSLEGSVLRVTGTRDWLSYQYVLMHLVFDMPWLEW